MSRNDYTDSSTATELGVRTAGVASLVAFSKAYAILVGGITFIIVARLLGPSGYGVYILALGIAGFIGAFGSLNISPYYNKYIPKLLAEKAHKKLGGMLWSSLLLLFAIGIALVILGFAISGTVAHTIFHSNVSTGIIDVAITTVLFSLLYTALYAILISFGRGKQVSTTSVLYRTLQSAVSITLVILGYGPLGAVVGYLAGLILAVILNAIFVARLEPPSFGTSAFKPVAREIFSFTAPLTGASIMGSAVSNFSIIFLGSLFLPSVVGAYGAASNIGAFIDTFTGSISIVLIPMFATAIASTTMRSKLGALYSNSVYLGLMFTMPVILYTAALSGAFVTSVFASTYGGAALYMSLISIGILVGLIASYGANLLMGLGEVKRVFKYAAISGVAQLAALIVTVPRLGAVGVIVSTLFVGGIAYDYLYVRYISKELKMGMKSNMSALVISNVAIFAVLLILPFSGLSNALQLVMGLVVLAMLYPALLGITKAVGHDEIRLLNRVGDGIPIFGAWLKALLAYAELFMRS